MIDVRRIPESDLEAVHRMRTRRIGDCEVETLRARYRAHPDLFVGAYDGDLVGFAVGRERTPEEAELDGIAVAADRTREGIGTALLSTFEERAAAAGYERVSLGSAGGYVDEFYLENGYVPSSVLVRLPPEEVPADARGYDVAEDRLVDGTRKLYLRVDGHDPSFLADVREEFGDPEAIYVMEKRL